MAPALNLRLLSASLAIVAASALSQAIPASSPGCSWRVSGPWILGTSMLEMLGGSFLHHNIWQVVGGVLMKGTLSSFRKL